MKKRILTILIFLNLALIWGNSLLPGESSGAISGGVVAFLDGPEGMGMPSLPAQVSSIKIRQR